MVGNTGVRDCKIPSAIKKLCMLLFGWVSRFLMVLVINIATKDNEQHNEDRKEYYKIHIILLYLSILQ